jgi:hypothetical protein
VKSFEIESSSERSALALSSFSFIPASPAFGGLTDPGIYTLLVTFFSSLDVNHFAAGGQKLDHEVGGKTRKREISNKGKVSTLPCRPFQTVKHSPVE